MSRVQFVAGILVVIAKQGFVCSTIFCWAHYMEEEPGHGRSAYKSLLTRNTHVRLKKFVDPFTLAQDLVWHTDSNYALKKIL